MASLVESRNEIHPSEDSRLSDLKSYFERDGFPDNDPLNFASNITSFFGRGNGTWHVEIDGNDCCVSVGSDSRPEQSPFSITFKGGRNGMSVISETLGGDLYQRERPWVILLNRPSGPVLMIGATYDQEKIYIFMDRGTGLFEIKSSSHMHG